MTVFQQGVPGAYVQSGDMIAACLYHTGSALI